MACEEGVPFVWTEGAHSLYLSFLEEAFVDDLYRRHYCCKEICGWSSPDAAAVSMHASSAGVTAESPSSAPPEKLPPSESVSRASRKNRGARQGVRGRSAKRRGKWLVQDAGPDKRQAHEPSIELQDSKSLVDQLWTSSHSDYVVPRISYAAPKRSRTRIKLDDIGMLGTDQVVPSADNQV